MTGPEHYLEAERLLAVPVSVDPVDQGAVIALHLAAQVHATLALAAANIAAAAHPGQSQVDYLGAWWRAGA